ncbi:sulfite exporter TauE/SafE family protein [Synechococcus sp. R55.3]|uniref:sulfite exporter TauE/SafE family protein n=1 Tax=unclassified Synechococcus TaxID=2626047 RepID=UPI0039C233CC
MSWWVTLLVGCGIGFCAGLFGLGGSSLGTPLLRLLGMPAALALASPLPLTLFSALGGVVTFQKRGMIHWRVVGHTVFWGIPAVALGAWTTKFLPGMALMLLTAMFILGIGLYGLNGLRGFLPGEGEKELHLERIPVGSVLLGFFNGLLANGGGLVLVPFYQLVVGLDLRGALASSLASVALLAVPAILVHSSLGHIAWDITFWLALGVFPCTVLGGRLALRLSTPLLTRLYGGFLVAMALYFGIREISQSSV